MGKQITGSQASRYRVGERERERREKERERALVNEEGKRQR